MAWGVFTKDGRQRVAGVLRALLITQLVISLVMVIFCYNASVKVMMLLKNIHKFTVFLLYGLILLQAYCMKLHYTSGFRLLSWLLRSPHWPRAVSVSRLWLISGCLIAANGLLVHAACKTTMKALMIELSSSLRIGISHYLTEPSWKKLIDTMQIELNCCGVEHPNDWHDIAWINVDFLNEKSNLVMNLSHVNGKVLPPVSPYSCCSPYVLTSCYHDPLQQEYSQHRIKHYNYSKIDRGICVTKTCVNYIKNMSNIDEDLETIVEKCLKDRFKEKHDLGTRLYGLNCDRHKEVSETDSLDNIVATIVVCLCAAVIFGSYYDASYCKNSDDKKIGKGGQLLLCFSAFRNMKQLFKKGKGDERLDDLKFFHAIRTICGVVVIYGHSLFFVILFVSDPHTYEKAYENIWGRIRFSSTSIVQLFFVFSGLILTYFLEIYGETHQVTWKSMPKFIFYRWWRLTPALAFVIAMLGTWFRYLGSGPLWKYFINNSTSVQCRQYFWAHIFFYNNYMTDDTLCAYQTWHIAADMQLFIMGLILYIAIRNRSLKFKVGTMTLLMVPSILSPAMHIWLQDLDAFVMQTPELYRTLDDESFRKYHIYGHNNATCFIIGMALGYVMYYLKQQKMEYPNFKLGNILCWLATPMVMGVFYVGSLFFVDAERPSLTLRILFAALHRFVIGIIATIWIMGITLKFNGCSKAIMEFDGWLVPSKLSYCVYLIHVEVFRYLMASRTQLLSVSFLNMFFVYIGVVVVSYVLALIPYLLVEAPSNSLIKLLKTDNINKKKEE